MLTAAELRSEHDRRREIKRATFRRITEDVMKTIKQRSDIGQMECFVTVPPFVVGMPTFDVATATKYVAYKLKKNGFEVWIGDGATLFVSWKGTRSRPEAPRAPPPPAQQDSMLIESFANLKKSASRIRAGKDARR